MPNETSNEDVEAAFADAGASDTSANPTETSAGADAPAANPESSPKSEEPARPGEPTAPALLGGKFKSTEALESGYKEIQSRADRLAEQNKRLDGTITELNKSATEFVKVLSNPEADIQDIRESYASMTAERTGIDLNGLNPESRLAMTPMIDKMRLLMDRVEQLESGNAQSVHDAAIKERFPHVDKVKNDITPIKEKLSAGGDPEQALLSAHEAGTKTGFDAGYQRAKAELAAAMNASAETGGAHVDATGQNAKLTPEQQDAAMVDEIFKVGSEKGRTFS